MNYSQENAKALIDFLQSGLGGKLTDFRYEIQDYGQFLLISSTLNKNTPLSEVDCIIEKIESKLHNALPTHEREYTWMVTISRDGQVVGSVTSELE